MAPGTTFDQFCEQMSQSASINAGDFICEAGIMNMDPRISDLELRVTELEGQMTKSESEQSVNGVPVYTNTSPIVTTPLTNTQHGRNTHWIHDVADNFEDAQDTDEELTFTGTYISTWGNPNLVQDLYFSGTILHLVTSGDSRGLINITVRVTDTDGLYVEDSFDVGLN